MSEREREQNEERSSEEARKSEWEHRNWTVSERNKGSVLVTEQEVRES